MMSDTLQVGFEKQRRNLVIIASAVFFIELTDIKFEKINILGNSAKIDNPEYVVFTMWILLVYWLIRFLNYFHDLPDIGYKNSFLSKRDSAVVRFLTWSFPRRKEVKEWLQNNPNEGRMKLFYDRHNIHISRLLKIELNIDFLTSDNADGGGQIQDQQFQYSGWSLFLANLYAFIRTTFFGRYFAEYVFPLVLVVLAISAKVGVFDSSILHTFSP